jgi:hypothetical protein
LASMGFNRHMPREVVYHQIPRTSRITAFIWYPRSQ